MLRHGARARVAHIASFAVRSGCKDNVVVVARRVSGRAHMECLSGRQVMYWWEMRGLGRFHRPAAILQAHSLIAEQQAPWSAVGDVDVGGGDKCACFRGDGDAVGVDQIIMFAETTTRSCKSL